MIIADRTHLALIVVALGLIMMAVLLVSDTMAGDPSADVLPPVNGYDQDIHRYYDPAAGVVCYVLRKKYAFWYWQSISCLPERDVHDIPPPEAGP